MRNLISYIISLSVLTLPACDPLMQVKQEINPVPNGLNMECVMLSIKKAAPAHDIKIINESDRRTCQGLPGKIIYFRYQNLWQTIFICYRDNSVKRIEFDGSGIGGHMPDKMLKGFRDGMAVVEKSISTNCNIRNIKRYLKETCIRADCSK